MAGAMDFYIDTLWSVDNIDGFYFRTHPRLMADREKALMVMDDALGFLAHLTEAAAQAYDPYRLALAAEQKGSPLGLLQFAMMAERLGQMGILDDRLQLKKELYPIVDRYRRGFMALEQQEKIEDPVRVLGSGGDPSGDENGYTLVSAACRNDHKSQYELAKRYIDIDRTCGIYWMHRAKENGNAYAAHWLLRHKGENR